MNSPRTSRTARLFRHLRHLIGTDSGLGVRRRNLRVARQGDIQLELELQPLAFSVTPPHSESF